MEKDIDNLHQSSERKNRSFNWAYITESFQQLRKEHQYDIKVFKVTKSAAWFARKWNPNDASIFLFILEKKSKIP
jgi:hypothetical protein